MFGLTVNSCRVTPWFRARSKRARMPALDDHTLFPETSAARRREGRGVGDWAMQTVPGVDEYVHDHN